MMDRELKDGKCGDSECFCKIVDGIVHSQDAEGRPIRVPVPAPDTLPVEPRHNAGDELDSPQIEFTGDEHPPRIPFEKATEKDLLADILCELREIRIMLMRGLPFGGGFPVVGSSGLADRELAALIDPPDEGSFGFQQKRLFTSGGDFEPGKCSLFLNVNVEGDEIKIKRFWLEGQLGSFVLDGVLVDGMPQVDNIFKKGEPLEIPAEVFSEDEVVKMPVSYKFDTCKKNFTIMLRNRSKSKASIRAYFDEDPKKR